jgi:hypothetical protein
MAYRLVFGLILLLLFPGVFSAFLWAGRLFLRTDRLLISILIGTILGIVFDQFVIKKVSYLQTLIHELGHASASLLLFRRVERFVATPYSGGEVYWSGGFGGEFGNDFIGLAPYTFPTFLFISVMVRPLLNSNWFPWFDIWIGFTFGLHAFGFVRDIRNNFSRRTFIGAWSGRQLQTDIASRGFIFSTIFIITLTLAIHGILLAIMLEGYRGILSWGQQFWPVTRNVCESIPKLLRMVQ